ncbi:hypothetical protein QE152_g3463 [Popillia japonica]|uniref:Uncharacterized protein n=1 Tax=Popillia japonica TaxID=7064 RepID=A0AAW1N205_POPJA
MDRLPLFVLNGRTAGDMPGNYTFANHNGHSIIDLAWVNIESAENVVRFEFFPSISSIEHNIMSTKIYTKTSARGPNSNTSLANSHDKYAITFRFNVQNADNFRDTMDSNDRIHFKSQDVEEMNENLICAIKETASSCDMLKVIKVKANYDPGIVESKPWFSRECLSLKLSVRKNLKT